MDFLGTFGYFSLNTTTVLVVVMTLAAYVLYSSCKRPEGFPPGPNAFPIVGNIPLFFSKKSTHETFADLRRKYGDIYSLKFGNRDAVVINNIELVKEALLKNAVACAGRPKMYSAGLISEGYKDIGYSDYGPQWRFQRKLAHTALRNFAQEEKLEKIVFSITPKIAKVLDELGDEPFAPKFTIGQIVIHTLATLCFGKQYEFNQPELMEHINLVKEMTETIGNGLPADFIPIFRYVPTSTEVKFKRILESFRKVFYDELYSHRESFDPGNIRDFVDSLLQTQQEALEAGEEEASHLTDTHLVQTVVDVYSGGSSTTLYTLQWAVALLAENPDVQDKVAAELDEVVGQDRLPSLHDRVSLPYALATVSEILRYSSVAPLGFPRSTMADISLGGYKIPKGSMIIVNHLILHFDPDVWDEPDKFRPERFLKDDGQLNPNFPESLLPFGCGRRVCLGEDFVKREIFLLFIWLFGRYTFYKVPGKEEESLLTLNEASGFARQPLDEMQVCVKKRLVAPGCD